MVSYSVRAWKATMVNKMDKQCCGCALNELKGTVSRDFVFLFLMISNTPGPLRTCRALKLKTKKAFLKFFVLNSFEGFFKFWKNLRRIQTPVRQIHFSQTNLINLDPQHCPVPTLENMLYHRQYTKLYETIQC